ncbi:MAG TPA: zinc ribbon domain-containing protein [Candidatus Poseidoniaceae archaeon]|nr:MAG TPA: zinc ribbon domain-containing protein [Candidatus Poseidoniales archaeon]HII96312.1 zinc ribbon domain-containing protein [Candidatus Poseidoniaceae archaeon]
MAGVFCPTCESAVSASAAYCLACGHDLTVQGPITSTGHDLNQLKEVVRLREDLSMAEKFDIIAKVEEGANPILLGIAAPAEAPVEGEEGEGDEAVPVQTSTLDAPADGWGQSAAARAASEAVARSSRAMGMVEAGTIDRDSEAFRAAMDRGFEAGRHLHAVACGAHEGADPEAMQDVAQLTPPERSFCPKCGSDINSFTTHQWTKWRGTADGVLLLELEAAMEAALVELAAHYEDRLEASESTDSDVDVKALRAEIEAEIRAELQAAEPASEQNASDESAAETTAEPEEKEAPKPAKPKAKSASKPKKGGMFGAKRPKMTYDGPAGAKGEWFLENALETVYDPHGTGKTLKPRSILARSSEGNVRVADVIHAYAKGGRDKVSALAWTSPQTEYLIEAFDAC